MESKGEDEPAIEVTEVDGELYSVWIRGERLEHDDFDHWIAPKALLKGLSIDEFPVGISFELCEQYEDGLTIVDRFPVYMTRIDEKNTLRIEFEDAGARKYWDGKIGFSHFMEAKRDVVAERQKELGDLKLKSFEDDGAWIRLNYSAEIQVDTFDLATSIVEQIVEEVEGAAELKFGGDIYEPDESNDEKEFTLRTVVPLLRKLGFANVKYNHGMREFGKDVVFARVTEFGELEHWGAQIKFGNVAGGANSEIDTIVGQLADAFTVPYYDIYTRARVRLSKVAVIISGSFTENASEKIVEKIESHAIRNNVVFVDRARLDSLLESVRRNM